MKKKIKELMQSDAHTPPATPPATRDLQMLRSSWVRGLAASPADFASEAIASEEVVLVRNRFWREWEEKEKKQCNRIDV